jgi:electron transport complex protein RnfG
MREMIKMVIVLTVLSSLSGGLLAAIRNGTKDRIENQQLEFVKGPAIRTILKGSSNDPIVDRFKIMDGDVERSFFVGIFDGKPTTVAFESSGKGFAGDIGLMVGINLDNDTIVGVNVTTHSETPGLGANAKDKPDFAAQFEDLSVLEPIQVSNDGGQISAMSGATITSRALCTAATEAGKIYKNLKPQVAEQLKDFTR